MRSPRRWRSSRRRRSRRRHRSSRPALQAMASLTTRCCATRGALHAPSLPAQLHLCMSPLQLLQGATPSSAPAAQLVMGTIRRTVIMTMMSMAIRWFGR